MNVKELILILKELDVSFFTGVPDSQLKPLCNYLINTYGISNRHIIAANEGSAVGIAAGHYISTNEIPCIYLQNSGIGNIVNPVVSLINDRVYAIPMVFIIGWRGEPNVKDEPQHRFQGEITLDLLDVLGIKYMIIDKDTNRSEMEHTIKEFRSLISNGRSVAFVVKKGSLLYDKKTCYNNEFHIKREDAIEHIIKYSGEDIIVSTTGKTSRELFEAREKNNQSHKYDFLTVGSMGHSSSIALGIALNKPKTRVWCIDGDGAVLMHMGAMTVIGERKPTNYIHVVINNGAHESVGGQPTVANYISFKSIAFGCGYRVVKSVQSISELDEFLSTIRERKGPVFLEIKSAIGSRPDLGRPTITPIKNKQILMDYLRECD